MRVLTRFLAAATDVAHFPALELPEIAFLGRSNVGKSSVINSLVGPKFIEPYLRERSTLALCVALVDAGVPPQQSDRQLLDFLSASGRDLLLIATKSDRLSGNQLRNALKTLGEEYPAARILAYSAKSGAGREELWKRIRDAAQQFWVREPSSPVSPD